MVWSQDAWPIVFHFLAIMLAVYLVESLIVGVLINVVLRSPWSEYLLSNIVVGAAIFLATEAFILFLPGQYVAFNSEPQNCRTWLVYNQGKINAIAVLIGLAAWQIFVRNRSRVTLESK